MRRAIAAILVAGMVVSPAGLPVPAMAQIAVAKQTTVETLKVNAETVLTNVVVRDKKTGAVIKDLKESDFTVSEDKKPQRIISFDYQNVDEAVTLAEATTVSGATATKKKTIADLVNNDFAAKPDELKNRRLIVMFFDLSSMQPEDITRAVDAAKDYINNKMAPADLAASVSLVSSLSMDQDFTNDKSALLAAVSKYDGTDSSGFAEGSEGRHHSLLRRLLQLHRRRQRVQRPQHRPPVVRHPHHMQVNGKGGAEEEHVVLLRRPHQAGHRERGQHPLRHQRVRQGRHGDVCGGRSRPAGPQPRRRRLPGQPPRHRCIQRRIHAVPAQLQLRLAGDPRHPRLRHRRQALHRLQRLRTRLPAGAARHRGLLHHRLPLHQPQARRHIPSSHHHPERPSRRQTGVPPRLLRPGRLPARQDRGPRTRPHRADAQRAPRHRRRRLPPGPLLPPGRRQVLHPHLRGRPRLADPCHHSQGQGQGNHRLPRPGQERPEHHGRPGAPDGQPRRRRQPAGAEEERPVLHRLHPRPRQVPPQVRRAREPVRQHGQLRDRHPGPGHEEDARSSSAPSS